MRVFHAPINSTKMVSNKVPNDTQVIVAKELNERSHIWLKSLTDRMGKEQARLLIDQSRKLLGEPESDYVESVLQIVSKANREIFDELKKEDEDMYSALVELMQPEIDEATKKAWDKAWDQAWDEASSEITAKKTVEAVDNAMKKLHMSKEEACAFMDITPEQYDAYKLMIKNADCREQKK